MLPQLPAKCESYPESSSPVEVVNHPAAPDPRPILSLRSQEQILYVELIQAPTFGSRSKEMLWVRPLLLAPLNLDPDPVLDLRITADLVWPASQFEPAYAEDLLPLLPHAEARPNAHQALNQFMHQVWQLHHQTLETHEHLGPE